MLLLRCPKCKQTMKYQGLKSLSDKSKKRCVYCGHSFGVKKAIVKSL